MRLLIHAGIKLIHVAKMGTREIGHDTDNHPPTNVTAWASCQIRKIAGCACAGNAGNVLPQPGVSDPDMHHGKCATHVSWCMPGPLTSSYLWSWWRGKRSRHSRCMRNPQFYVSRKRPIEAPLDLLKGKMVYFWHEYTCFRLIHCGAYQKHLRARKSRSA